MTIRRACCMALAVLIGCNQNNPQETAERPAPAEAESLAGSPPSTELDEGEAENRAASEAPDAAAAAGDAPADDDAAERAPADPGAAPATPEETQEALMEKARAAVRAGDYESTIVYLEQMLEADPENVDLQFQLGMANQLRASELAEAGDRKAASSYFIASAKHLQVAVEQGGDLYGAAATQLSHALYNAARSLALQGKQTEALATLHQAIESGYSDLAEIQQEADLASLRETPEFQQLLEEGKAKIAAAKRAHLEELLARHEAFDFDFALPNLDGETVSLSDYRGKVVIVDFWGTWCPPCRKEIPHFLELLENYKDQGLEVVGINYEQVDNVKETIAAFNKEHGVTYPCLIGDRETQAQVPDFRGYPTTLFIDRSGSVQLMLVGYHEYGDLEMIVKHLLEQNGDAEESPPEQPSAPAESGAP